MKINCILNGRLLPAGEASLLIGDLALRRGYGIFDYFRVHDGQPLYMEDHLQRLMNGARILRIDRGLSTTSLTGQVTELLAANNMKGITAIRIVVTGGYSSFAPEQPNVIITQEPMTLPPEQVYSKGAAVITHEFQRELPEVKSISYLTAIYLEHEMKEAGAMEILYHSAGNITEFTRSNIFAVSHGELVTPASGVLAGITRKNVMLIARDELPVRESGMTLTGLLQADEVFMTSTIKRIIPVTTIDGKQIGQGIPGQVTRKLMSKLAELDRRQVG